MARFGRAFPQSSRLRGPVLVFAPPLAPPPSVKLAVLPTRVSQGSRYPLPGSYSGVLSAAGQSQLQTIPGLIDGFFLEFIGATFRPSAAQQFDAQHVAVGGLVSQVVAQLGKTGAPSDGVVAELWTDDGTGNEPGLLIATSTNTIPAASLPVGDATPFTFTFSGAVIPAGPVWVAFRRTGALDNVDYFTLAGSNFWPTFYGNAAVTNGAGVWSPHSQTVYGVSLTWTASTAIALQSRFLGPRPPLLSVASLSLQQQKIAVREAADLLTRENWLRRKVQSNLRPPSVTRQLATFTASPIKVKLVRQRPPKRTAYLSPPVVIFAAAAGPPQRTATHLAYSRRGVPFSKLRGPVLVTATRLAPPIRTKLVRARPPKRTAYLSPPVVIFAPIIFLPKVSAHLAYSLRGRGAARLLPPQAVATATAALSAPIEVKLAYSRRGRPVSHLSPPTVTTQVATLAAPITARLAYSRRGHASSRLAPPTVVGPILAAPILARLTYSRRGRPLSALRAPTVVGPVLARPLLVRLVRITPPRVHSTLRPPTDTVGLEDQGRVKITLAYSRRGRPLSTLREPTVVAPVVVLHEDIEHLAYSRRGAPKSRLSAPTVVAPVLAPPIIIHRAYSLRGRPLSILREPVVVAPVLAQPTVVSLAYSSRGKARYQLGEPTIVSVFVGPPIAAHLTYSRRGVPKPKLNAPTVVAPVLAAPVATALAYSLRGHPKSRLAPPTVVAPILAQPIDVHLAYSRRGRPPQRFASRPSSPRSWCCAKRSFI